MMIKHSTSGAIAGRTNVRFYEYVSIGGNAKYHAFTTPVVWVYQSETSYVLTHGGNEVRNYRTLNDYYGLMTSIKSENDVDEILSRFNITSQSSLKLEAVCTISLKPFLEEKEHIEHNSRAQKDGNRFYFLTVPNDFRVMKLIRSDDDVEYRQYSTIEPIICGRDKVFDSSFSKEKIKQVVEQYVNDKSSNKTIASTFNKHVLTLPYVITGENTGTDDHGRQSANATSH